MNYLREWLIADSKRRQVAMEAYAKQNPVEYEDVVVSIAAVMDNTELGDCPTEDVRAQARAVIAALPAFFETYPEIFGFTMGYEGLESL